jgi:hypothetical protein
MIHTLIEDKLEEHDCAITQARDKVTINRLTEKWICFQIGAYIHDCNFPFREALGMVI